MHYKGADSICEGGRRSSTISMDVEEIAQLKLPGSTPEDSPACTKGAVLGATLAAACIVTGSPRDFVTGPPTSRSPTTPTSPSSYLCWPQFPQNFRGCKGLQGAESPRPTHVDKVGGDQISQAAFVPRRKPGTSKDGHLISASLVGLSAFCTSRRKHDKSKRRRPTKARAMLQVRLPEIEADENIFSRVLSTGRGLLDGSAPPVASQPLQPQQLLQRQALQQRQQQLQQQPRELEQQQPQQLQEQPPGSAQPSACAVPSEEEVRELFRFLDASKTGSIGLEEIEETIMYLENRGEDGLSAEDSLQLYKYLRAHTTGPSDLASSSAGAGVSRDQFVAGIRELTGTLSRLEKNGITLHQMKIVLLAAFERFDLNHDGHISLTEFLAAAEYLGFRISVDDASCLYSFLCPSKEDVLSAESLDGERSLQEKWTEAVGRSIEQTCKRKGLNGIAALMSRMQTNFAAGGSLEDRLKRVWTTAVDGIDDACNFAELGLDLAGVAVAVKYIAEITEESLQSHTSQPLDVETLFPFVTFVGLNLVNTVKELNDIVPREMSADEAQLYGQIFHPNGFSQAQFRRLLSCPGFSWVSIKAGEEFHQPGDSNLRILLRGSAEVQSVGQAGTAVAIPAGSILGDIAFLHQRSLWSKETITARDRIFCASWDHEKLRQTLNTDEELSMQFDSLLTESMVANVQAKAKLYQGETPPLSRRAGLNPDLSPDLSPDLNPEKLLQAMDANNDGVVCEQEFEAGSELLSRILMDAKTNGNTEAAVVGLMVNETVTSDTLELIMPFILKRLNLGDDGVSRQRMFSYLDVNGDGIISLDEFQFRMAQIDSCIFQMKGLSLKELESVMYRAFTKFDVNKDGVISEEEFVAVAEMLLLPLTKEQMKLLFQYFDCDQDGCIDYFEWQAGAGCQLSFADALRDSLQEQAERKGLVQCSKLVNDIGLTLMGPGDLLPKVKRAVDRAVDDSDALAELANTAADFSGTGVALYGMWRELSGASGGEDSEVDWAPFLVFFSILGVNAVRRLAEGQVTDLSGEEALLYATGFESNGFKVSEFRKLLRYGNARWKSVLPGEVVSSATDTSLKIISQGTCEVRFAGSQSGAVARRGQILGAAHFFDTDMEQEARALEPTTLLVLDGEALRESLAHDESLTRRFNQSVSKSMVDAFLDSQSQQ